MIAPFLTQGGFQFPGDHPQKHVLIFGKSSGIDLTAQDVWLPDGIKVYPSAAAVADLVSANADDTALGTGARSVLVHGLDANFNEQEEVIALDGVTPVTTVNTWIRIFKLCVIDTGSGGMSAGAIECTIGADLQAKIFPVAFPTPIDTSLGTHYTIPAGKTGYLTQWNVSRPNFVNAQETYLQRRLFDTTLNNPAWNIVDIDLSVMSSGLRPFVTPIEFPEKTDLVARAWAASATQVAVTYEILLIDTPMPAVILP